MSMPHEPHTPMRQDDRQARVGSWVSLICHSPSSTVMPGVYGIV